MDKDIKEEWIDRLRSGNYNQTTGYLNRTNLTDSLPGGEIGHCCLGILCEIAVERGISTKEEIVGDGYAEFDGVYGMPSNYVLDWASLTFDDASYLSTENDSGVPFTSIADIIEERF